MTYDIQPEYTGLVNEILHDEEDNHNEIHDERECFDILACEKVVDKIFSINVPVSIKPYAEVIRPEVRCLGEARFQPHCEHCHKDFEFKFDITQRIRVSLPVKFRALICFHEECVEEERIS